jgi:hypothetical protein
MKQKLEWFIERIGKTVVAASPNAFNGEMKITDDAHAKHLCNVAQEYQQYTFADTSNETPND